MASAKVAKVKRTPKEPLPPLEDKCKDFDVLTTLGEIFFYPNFIDEFSPSSKFKDSCSWKVCFL